MVTRRPTLPETAELGVACEYLFLPLPPMTEAQCDRDEQRRIPPRRHMLRLHEINQPRSLRQQQVTLAKQRHQFWRVLACDVSGRHTALEGLEAWGNLTAYCACAAAATANRV